ncbi:SAM-dependent methyltransferase [Spongiibacter taiwanensis]|uniref:N-6 DNA methylase n=1 Tax=Spongiibacter taiwanensis TaxID=1748242 RepID=UPI002034AC58|nr:N-6 DNA methylase [Spongiibacter taiwanensis]USA44731.1 SAM-dependent methyltransferase [Spongiibacter taiwanensis]
MTFAQRRLLALQSDCKGQLKPDDFFSTISFILALAAEHPQLLKLILAHRNTPVLCRQTLARELLQLQIAEPKRPWHFADLDKLPLEAILGIAAEVVRHRGLVADFAAATRSEYAVHAYKRPELKLAYHRYLQSKLGDLTGIALLDSNCGLTFKFDHFERTSITLNDPNPTVGLISHWLLIAEGDKSSFLHCDYLLEACQPSTSGENCTLRDENAFDLIVTEPPARAKLEEKLILKLNSQFPFFVAPRQGQLPSTAGLSLWIQHTLRQLKPDGHAYLIVPCGWLYRGGYDAQVRRALVLAGSIVSVSALNSDLQGESDKALVVLRKPNTKKASTVTFADDSSAVRYELDILRQETEEILRHPSRPYCINKCISVEEIINDECRRTNLNPSYYLRRPAKTKSSVDRALRKLEAAADTANRAQKTLTTLVRKHQKNDLPGSFNDTGR